LEGDKILLETQEDRGRPGPLTYDTTEYKKALTRVGVPSFGRTVRLTGHFCGTGDPRGLSPRTELASLADSPPPARAPLTETPSPARRTPSPFNQKYQKENEKYQINKASPSRRAPQRPFRSFSCEPRTKDSGGLEGSVGLGTLGGRDVPRRLGSIGGRSGSFASRLAKAEATATPTPKVGIDNVPSVWVSESAQDQLDLSFQRSLRRWTAPRGARQRPQSLPPERISPDAKITAPAPPTPTPRPFPASEVGSGYKVERAAASVLDSRNMGGSPWSASAIGPGRFVLPTSSVTIEARALSPGVPVSVGAASPIGTRTFSGSPVDTGGLGWAVGPARRQSWGGMNGKAFSPY